ncbi:hypothetical protein ACOME3_008098 [Neoechinorhynchus agilis]
MKSTVTLFATLIGLSSIRCLPTTNGTSEEKANATKGLLISIPPSLTVGQPSVFSMVPQSSPLDLPSYVPLSLLNAITQIPSIPTPQSYSSIPLVSTIADPFTGPLISTAALPQPVKTTIISYLKTQNQDTLGPLSRFMSRLRPGFDPLASTQYRFGAPTTTILASPVDPIALAAFPTGVPQPIII